VIWGGLRSPRLIPPSPPSGPMTRARAKAIHDKVDWLLSSCDFDSPLDGLLLHYDTLCVIRYNPQERPPLDQGVEKIQDKQVEKQLKATRLVLPIGVPVLPALHDHNASSLRPLDR